MATTNCEQTIDKYQIELLALDTKTWKHETVYNRINNVE